MSFYIMRQDTSIDGSCSLDGVPDGIESLDWMQGKTMADPAVNQKLALELSLESGDYRGHIIDGFLTLYHDALKEALEQQGVDNIAYYPVTLRDQNTNEVEGGYWRVNILGLLDCVDMAKSKVKWWPSGMGFNFLSMVIDEQKTHGAKLFRLKDDPTKVIINEELKAFFDKTDMLVGVKLIKTEDYSDF
jgi:hypothetical protein